MRSSRRPVAPLADIAVPMAIRLTQVVLQLYLLDLLNRGSGRSLHSRLLEWDGQYYAQIAGAGYPTRIVAGPDGTLTSGAALAFHPVYPLLAGLVHLVSRLPVDSSLLVVATLAGLIAAALCHLLVMQLGGGRRAGYCAAALFGALPMSVVFQMAYAEALFAVFTLAALYAAYRDRWLLAGVLTFAAGLTRPVAIVIALALPLIALARPAEGSADQVAQQSAGPSRNWRAVALATVLGGLGAPMYWLFVGLRTHQLDGWFQIQRLGWNTHFDGGAETVQFLRDTIERPEGLAGPAVCLILLGFAATLVITMRRAVLPLWALSALVLFIVVTSTNYWHSKPRLLLAGCVLVVPLALRCERISGRTLLTGLITLSIVSAWFGAYLVDVWQYAI